MEKTMDFAELEELKAQFDILNEKLERQTIINETLLKESMKQKLSYVDRTYRMYRNAGLITTPIMLALLLLYKAPLAMCIFIVVSLIMEQILYRREFRKLDTKTLMSLEHIDAVERVAIFRKNFRRINTLMLIPGITIFILFVGLVTGYKFDAGTVLLYLIFVLITLTYEVVRQRKMFKNLDAVLKLIEELRSEE